jgi:glycosyltransferase involved in cell wall biosynthesis
MKKRIAVYSPTQAFWGGSFQYAKAVVEALALLDRELFDVQVWHAADGEWDTLVTGCALGNHDIAGYDIPARFVPAAKKILAALDDATDERRRALLEELEPFAEITLLHAWRPHVVICPQMGGQHYVPGARQVGVIHDLMHRYEPQFPEVGTPEEILARENLFATMVAQCDAILVDSKTGMRHVLECYRNARPQQLRVVPFAAFGEVVHCEPRKPSFAVPEKYLFYPAQFWLHKNHAGLARAAAVLAGELPDLCLVLAGNTAQNGYAAFVRVVQEHGLESMLLTPGYLPAEELAWLYRHARAFIMPTYFGPTNIPPLEAMTLGCPTAVSDVYGMREECGEAALYFKPDDISGMVDAIRRLWTDDALCEKLAGKGKIRAKLFSVEKFNKNIERMMNEICYNIFQDDV